MSQVLSGVEAQPGSYINQLVTLNQTVKAQQETIEMLKAQVCGKTSLSPNAGQFDPEGSKGEKSQEDDLDPFGLKFSSTGEPLDKDEEEDFFSPLQDTEVKPEYGEDVFPSIADGMNKTVTRPLSTETLKKLTEAYKVPGNCKPMTVPRMNSDIWNQLPGKARMADLSVQQQQQILSMGLTCLTKIVQLVGSNKDKIPQAFGKEIQMMCKDGANVLGHGFQQAITKRRNDVKQFLQPDYVGICNSTTPVTEYLFGDDFKELAKASKASLQIVKKEFPKDRNRFTPYGKSARYPSMTAPSHGSTSGKLNRYRPSYGQSMNNRRGGFRGFSRQQPRQQSSWKNPNDYNQRNQHYQQ